MYNKIIIGFFFCKVNRCNRKFRNISSTDGVDNSAYVG